MFNNLFFLFQSLFKLPKISHKFMCALKGFCKFKCFHSWSSTLNKNKLRVRNDYSNTAFISSHVCRKPCPFFLQANIFKDEKLLPPPVKRGYNFEMERRIKIRRHGVVGNPFDNNLAKFQSHWSSGCRLGVQNARTTRPNFHFGKPRTIDFRPQWD